MLRYPAINIQPVGWSDGRPQSIHNFSLFCFDQNLSKLSPLFLKMILFFKWPNAGLFFVYFRSFQTNNTIFTTNQCENFPSSIRCWDLNPQPLEHKSSPIITRPGLPPEKMMILFGCRLLYLKFFFSKFINCYGNRT